MEEIKKEIKEITDEQADKAAGGIYPQSFICKKCGERFFGTGIRTSSGIYCTNCAPVTTVL